MGQVYDYVFKKRDSVSKLSLDRVRILLNYLDNPQDKLKFIHIAGTNGKGSVTTTISNIMIESGYKVGKYISPYVDNFYERIQINNEYIDEEKAKNILQKLMPCIDSMIDAPTPFEILAALAFEYFYENKCDIVCLEVGLGGRFDATNIITTNLISIITVIDYDHVEYLGNTIEEIAFEKCGIIKDNKVTISYPLQIKNAELMIETMASIRNNKFIKINLNNLNNVQKDEFNYKFTYCNKDYILGLNGKHQIYNTLLAIECINELNKKGFDIVYETVFNAIKNTKFIGRLDKVKSEPIVVLDGAHNVSGARALKEFIMENKVNRKIILIIGMIKGKEHQKFLNEIGSLPTSIIITKINDEIKKSANVDELFKIATKYNENVEIELSNELAYYNAIKKANKNDIIIITGSLYLVSDFYEMFKEKKLL